MSSGLFVLVNARGMMDSRWRSAATAAIPHDHPKLTFIPVKLLPLLQNEMSKHKHMQTWQADDGLASFKV